MLLLGGVAAYVIADGDTPDAIATVDGAPLVTDGDEEATDPTVGGSAGEVEQLTTGDGSLPATTPTGH